MKKFTYTLLIASFFSIFGCTSTTTGSIISNCCHKLSVDKIRSVTIGSTEENNRDAEDLFEVTLLPTNSWDAKRLIW